VCCLCWKALRQILFSYIFWEQKLVNNHKFIWRFKIDDEQAFEIKSMARKNLRFEMKNFSDFALTRSDGSFTFLFTTISWPM